MKRRQFVGGLAAAAGLAACSKQEGVEAPASRCGETFEWSIATSWPPKYPGLGIAVNNLAQRIESASGGRLKLKVYAAGELVPAFEAFDAASRGTVEMGHDAAYYHKGKVPAAQFMTAIPFGMTFMEMNAWLYYGDGLKLWRELYEPFNLVPFPCGNTGVQMGGWFNKEINSIADLKGLKMRIPGLGGEFLRRAGGTPVTLSASEIFTSLQTGAIDATEWVGPYNDTTLGLHTVARYYYYPGWQEPAPALQAYVNRQAWDSLPPDLQAIIDISCQAVTTDMQAEYAHGNALALEQLTADPDVQLRRFPDDVLQYLKSIAQEIVEEMVADDPMAAKIYKSWSSFLEKSIPNSRITEQAFLATRR